MLLPGRFNISYVYAPVANSILIGITGVIYFLTAYNYIPGSISEAMILKEWSFDGLIGCLFLHGNIPHLIGNMFFLWMFGNAINSVVGNVWYIFVYLFLGLCASASHLIFSDAQAIGASGAVNGIIGMALVLFPTNKIELNFLTFVLGNIDYSVTAYKVILFWLLGDLLGALSGDGDIAYWAHLGGFFSGMAVATILLAHQKVMSEDRSLFEFIRARRRGEKEPVTTTSKDYLLNVKDRLKILDKDPFMPSDLSSFGEEVPKVIRKDDDPFGLETYTKPITEPVKSSAVEGFEAPSSSPYPESTVQPATPPKPIPTTPGVVKGLPVVSLRLLRIVRDNNQLTCFFVNNGDELENLSIESSDGMTAEIYPNKILKKKEPGWIKLKFEGGTIPQSVAFNLNYDGGNGEILQCRLTLEEETNRFVNE